MRGLVSAQVAPPAVTAAGAVPVGEVAEVPGGLLRVDAVLPEHMAPMQMGKLPRSSMGVDMVPEGQQRFTVEVSLAAGKGGLDYSTGDFRLSGEEIEGSAPICSQLGDGTLPAGSETHGALIFQAPAEAKGLALSFDGGEPIGLDSGNGVASGGKSSEDGHGH